MKYIMFKKDLAGLAMMIPVVFPNTLVHAEVAEALLAGPLEGCVADSAGELSSYDFALATPSGESESLGLKSNPERDARVLRGCDYGSMYE